MARKIRFTSALCRLTATNDPADKATLVFDIIAPASGGLRINAGLECGTFQGRPAVIRVVPGGFPDELVAWLGVDAAGNTCCVDYEGGDVVPQCPTFPCYACCAGILCPDAIPPFPESQAVCLDLSVGMCNRLAGYPFDASLRTLLTDSWGNTFFSCRVVDAVPFVGRGCKQCVVFTEEGVCGRSRVDQGVDCGVGACCLSDDTCIPQITPTACEGRGGEHLGAGSKCSYTRYDLSSEQCVAFGGVVNTEDPDACGSGNGSCNLAACSTRGCCTCGGRAKPARDLGGGARVCPGGLQSTRLIDADLCNSGITGALAPCARAQFALAVCRPTTHGPSAAQDREEFVSVGPLDHHHPFGQQSACRTAYSSMVIGDDGYARVEYAGFDRHVEQCVMNVAKPVIQDDGRMYFEGSYQPLCTSNL